MVLIYVDDDIWWKDVVFKNLREAIEHIPLDKPEKTWSSGIGAFVKGYVAEFMESYFEQLNIWGRHPRPITAKRFKEIRG